MTAAELSAANSHRATSPAVRHTRAGDDGQSAAVAIGQPAPERCGDGAHRRDRRAGPARPSARRRGAVLDQERYRG